MKQTREQILAHYKALQAKGKHGVEAIDQDELLCSYQTKKVKKVVFFTDCLDRETFKRFCQAMNRLEADKIVVYCDTATYESPSTAEILLNRDEPTMY